jgi:hypothetical protein
MQKEDWSNTMEAGATESKEKLMASGTVCLPGHCDLLVEVRRGMTILSKEGRGLGKVAAVVVQGSDHKTTHVLLTQLPEQNGYWMVPVGWILDVGDESLRISVTGEATTFLPEWHSP